MTKIMAGKKWDSRGKVYHAASHSHPDFSACRHDYLDPRVPIEVVLPSAQCKRKACQLIFKKVKP